MTRTERSHSLRALVKDRSEARNGMDSSVPKGGAGAHNWGSVASELFYENAAMTDETYEFEDQATGGAAGTRLSLYDVQVTPRLNTWWKRTSFSIPADSQEPPKLEKPAVVRRVSSITEEDRENALKVRKNALKNNGGMLSDPLRLSL
jgi:hypothetical protein